MSLRFAILGFLSVRPLSGYDLKRTFDTSVRHFWTADQAAIYRALGELEADGLVAHDRISQETRPDRKVFRTTEAGTEALDAWLALPAQIAPRREPLLIRLFFSSRLDAGAWRAVVEAELGTIEEELGVLAAAVAAFESKHRDADPSVQPLLIGPLITLSNGVELGVTYRRWLRGLLRAQDDGSLTVSHLLRSLNERLGD
jgi:PadR family transcriptional regulator AphA